MSVPPVVYDGVYGPYTVTGEHRREVLAYRLSLLLVALAQVALLLQWRWLGPSWCWPWLLLMAAGLGGALRWVHIYLVPLHRALQLFWLLGCAGFGLLAYRAGAASMLPQLVDQPAWIWLVGPFFAALAGLGFKEFFCFQRPGSDRPHAALAAAAVGLVVGAVVTGGGIGAPGWPGPAAGGFSPAQIPDARGGRPGGFECVCQAGR